MNSLRKITAGICSLAMMASVAAMPCGTMVNAGQILGETSFTNKIIPWHVVSMSPAKQNFEITSDGELHVDILVSEGEAREKWDLQVRHRNLNFKAGHTYTVSFKAKARRNGMELCSKISNIMGDEEYCVLNYDKFQNGPAMGGNWGKAMILTTEWQEVTGTFECTEDLEACEWTFQYAKGTKYEGNAQSGDEIWFDDMSIVCEDCDECVADPNNHYGAVSRSYTSLKNNFISVNQVGYFPDRKKVAVLSDNAGDCLEGAEKISLSGAKDFEVIDAESGEAVFKGTFSEPVKDRDSGDTICKLDFSEVKKPGTYYIRSGDYISYEFKIGNDIYSEKGHDLLTNAVNFFYQNRSGADIEENYITSGDKTKLAHEGSHNDDTAKVQKIWKNEYRPASEAGAEYASSEIDTAGGWYDSSDHCKYVVNGGMSVWTLQNMYERSILAGEKTKFDDGSGTVVVPEAGNSIPDILDEAAVELDWMAGMKVDASEPEWGETAAGLYYHKVQDSRVKDPDLSPYYYEEKWEAVRIVKPPTFAATLNYAACAAQAARLWQPYDSEKAGSYLRSAIDAYKAYKAAYYEADKKVTTHPDLRIDCTKEELNEKSFYAPQYHMKGGDAYGDDYVLDDAYWASCELSISASVMGDDYADEALKELESFEGAYEVNSSREDDFNEMTTLSAFDWRNTASAGSFALALHKDLLSEKNSKKLTDSLLKAADEFIKSEEKQGYGLPYDYDSVYDYYDAYGPKFIIRGYECDSNSRVINNAIALAYAYDLSGDDRYIDGVTSAMDYLLGTNPLSFSYVSGYGEYCMHNPTHTYWRAELNADSPSAPDGVLAAGPNAFLSDPYIRSFGFVPGKSGNPTQRFYVDSVEANYENRVSAGFNSSLAWVVSFLQDSSVTSQNVKTDPSPSPDQKYAEMITGDIDGSGIIDVTDLTTLAVSLVESEPLTGNAYKNADVTKDGKVDLTDLATLRQYLSKKITSFE